MQTNQEIDINPHPEPVAPQDSFGSRFWSTLGWLGIILIAANILFFFYLSYDTRYVPNTYFVNQTDPTTNITTQIPVIRYAANDLVPLRAITNNESILASILLAGLVLYILRQLNQQPKFFTERQAKEIALKEATYQKNQLRNPIFRGQINPLVNSYMEYRQFGNERPQFFMWHNMLEVLDEKNHHRYVEIMIDPYTGYIMGFIEVEEEIGRKNLCPKCGGGQIVKYISPAEYKMFLETYGRPRGNTQ